MIPIGLTLLQTFTQILVITTIEWSRTVAYVYDSRNHQIYTVLADRNNRNHFSNSVLIWLPFH